jgi:hypothetical protein
MESPPRKILLFFYRTSAGAEPVREWLRELGTEDRNVIGQDLMRIQYRWPVGMPLCRPLSGCLWEVRPRSVFRGGLPDRRGAWLRPPASFGSFSRSSLPGSRIALAAKRMKEMKK